MDDEKEEVVVVVVGKRDWRVELFVEEVGLEGGCWWDIFLLDWNGVQEMLFLLLLLLL